MFLPVFFCFIINYKIEKGSYCNSMFHILINQTNQSEL